MLSRFYLCWKLKNTKCPRAETRKWWPGKMRGSRCWATSGERRSRSSNSATGRDSNRGVKGKILDNLISCILWDAFRHPVLSVFFCFSAILWTLFIIVVSCILITYLAVYLGFVKGELFSNLLSTPGSIVDLRVLALNCWGMPGNTVHLSEDKELRMKHIGDMISKVRTHYMLQFASLCYSLHFRLSMTCISCQNCGWGQIMRR